MRKNILLVLIGILISILGLIYTSYILEKEKDNPYQQENLLEEKEEIPSNTEEAEYTLLVFHNGKGPMCLEAIQFFKDNNLKYTEYLNTQEDFNIQVSKYTSKFQNISKGVSTSFGYYPIIIIGDNAYSGFNTQIGEEILNNINNIISKDSI